MCDIRIINSDRRLNRSEANIGKINEKKMMLSIDKSFVF
jgi:hypothetical protein